jgi:16S rRNA (cytosine967-C5)-methyltransferase
LVVAADLSETRLGRLTENVARLGPLPITVLVADGRAPAIQAADVALLDAPCTGTGTFRRHADGRWRVGPDDLAALTRLQAELLEATAAVVRPGGWLVYATCSLEEEENETQVDAFLERHPEFEIDAPAGFDEGDESAAAIDGAGRLRILPHVQGFDGAFAVRMRRRR